MNKNEEVTLQERLDALEYETGSRMDMFDSAIRNAGGFDQPEEVTFKDKLKLAGNWVVTHKEELLVASVTVVTGAVIDTDTRIYHIDNVIRFLTYAKEQLEYTKERGKQ